jgi:hypothetical protein
VYALDEVLIRDRPERFRKCMTFAPADAAAPLMRHSPAPRELCKFAFQKTDPFRGQLTIARAELVRFIGASGMRHVSAARASLVFDALRNAADAMTRRVPRQPLIDDCLLLG